MENKAWFIWQIRNLIVIFSNMQIIYTFISVKFETELRLTIAQVALANSAYTWTFAISQFFSGAMFNVFSSKKIQSFSLSIMLFGFIVFIKSDNLEIYGNLIIVEHKDNYMTVYSYLKNIQVEIGDKVKQGQVIGSAGKSSTQDKDPQMCFTIRHNGQAVDPLVHINCD